MPGWRVLPRPSSRLVASTLLWPAKGDVVIGRLVRSVRQRGGHKLERHYDWGSRLTLRLREHAGHAPKRGE